MLLARHVGFAFSTVTVIDVTTIAKSSRLVTLSFNERVSPGYSPLTWPAIVKAGGGPPPLPLDVSDSDAPRPTRGDAARRVVGWHDHQPDDETHATHGGCSRDRPQ